MAKKIGTGSSRVAFIIPFEGRDTVLKVAKNKKGIAQNEKEVGYLDDMYIPACVIPLIDYDKEHEHPRWIQTEKAEKLTASKFKQLTGFSFETFGRMLRNSEGKYIRPVDETEKEKIQESELFNNVVELHGNFSLMLADFTRLANWGIYNNEPG